MMTILKSFLEYRRSANLARCNIKTWLITVDQADAIADAMSHDAVEKARTLAHIHAGGMTLLGAPLKVKQ